MSSSIIIAAIFAFLAAGVVVLRKLYGKNAATTSTDDSHDHHDGEDGTCCGKHTNCSKGYDNSKLYFEDEELDRFKGMKSDEYTDEEIEEFRQVLYTMREDEVENWAHCIETRGIELPAEIRDEVLMMLQ
ncbi:MAG: hypothetical protein IIW75_06065 [Bacteroidaceae bacterium]|nr:hypothetical protein [Bacteroidaceae bacterium]